MNNVEFLTADDALVIHAIQIERFGGASGLRDKALLESALASPTASFDGKYLHSDLCEMAAAIAFQISQNHPFIDGNKRTGFTPTLRYYDADCQR